MQNRDKTARIVQFIFIVSLVPALIGSLLLSLLWISYAPLLLALIIFVFAGHFLIKYLAKRGKNVEWVLSIAVINLLILTPEVYLLLFQFHYETGIQFAYPRSFQKFARHEDLFWTYPIGQEGVNSLGFKQEEFKIPKPANTCRILFFGDSVVEQGYPAVVERVLNRQSLAMPAENINMGLSGYSTYQGTVLTDEYGEQIAPDIVVVAYGWNDHWLAYGSIDSKKVINTDLTPGQRTFEFVYTNSRLLQWVAYVFSPLLDRQESLGEVRVPLDEYQQNIAHIGHFFEDRDVPVVFITPPSAHYSLGVPDELIDGGFAEDADSVINRHRAYNQAVRDVANANGWLVLELEQEFEDAPNLQELFISDGIHLTDRGLQVVGQEIAEFINGLACLQPAP